MKPGELRNTLMALLNFRRKTDDAARPDSRVESFLADFSIEIMPRTAEKVDDFRRRGFLLLVHAMLISIYQLNALILKHNRVPDSRRVRQVKLGLARGPREEY